MRSYRSGPSKAFCCTAVPLIRATKKQFLLFSKRGIGTQSYPYESNRRDSYKVAVLWLETCCRCTEERGIRDKSKEGSTPFASHGALGYHTIPKYLEKLFNAQKVPLSAQGLANRAATAGCQLRYHIHSLARWLCLSCGSHRLVQSNDFVLEAFKQPRWGLLHRSVRGSFGVGKTRDFQYRSGSTIHLERLCRSSPFSGSATKYGWQGKSSRQCICRKILEVS